MKNRHIIIFGLIILLILVLFSICLGRYPISVADFLSFWSGKNSDPRLSIIIFNIRFPRIVAAIAIGGTLSISGAAYQGLFKNPMVSPDILGVTSGAAFGAALAILFSLPVAGIQLLSFLGGIGAVFFAVSISKSIGKTHDVVLVLVLAGIIISSLFSALLSLIKFVADTDSKLPAITYWLMGSLSSIRNEDLLVVIPILIVSIVPLLLLSWRINVLSLGEDEARSIGLDTSKLRIVIIICASLSTACIVSISGIIGWVGLIIPHLSRFIVGPNHKILLPVSFLIGGIFLLIVDDIARSVSSVEIPIGIITSIIGAPCFLYFLKKSSKKTW
jgi:iron complex transport system permease protein